MSDDERAAYRLFLNSLECSPCIHLCSLGFDTDAVISPLSVTSACDTTFYGFTFRTREVTTWTVFDQTIAQIFSCFDQFAGFIVNCTLLRLLLFLDPDLVIEKSVQLPLFPVAHLRSESMEKIFVGWTGVVEHQLLHLAFQLLR